MILNPDYALGMLRFRRDHPELDDSNIALLFSNLLAHLESKEPDMPPADEIYHLMQEWDQDRKDQVFRERVVALVGHRFEEFLESVESDIWDFSENNGNPLERDEDQDWVLARIQEALLDYIEAPE